MNYSLLKDQNDSEISLSPKLIQYMNAKRFHQFHNVKPSITLEKQFSITRHEKALIQEYIKEAGGADIRCLVVGDKVVAAMKRQAAAGEFRSNLHRGGSASLVKITPAERATAVKAAKVMGLNVAGVDLLRSERGPLVLEVNSSPGLEGIEVASGKDVAGMIIDFIEKQAKPGKTRTRGQG